ncbi:hypothetical protein GOODEAATRI_005604 [Goodea atripinnis]|uniref:PDZ domain-containing protein n=1 Tax=Goodea atripinnis TaxID=208336 RepID=A0ABV0N9L1_9TELE
MSFASKSDGKLKEADQILAINGQPLDHTVSHQQAINILQSASENVQLTVARGPIPQLTSPVVSRTPSAASTLSAHSSKDGRLRSGDHILRIGDTDLLGMGSEQVAQVLRQCGNRVKLVVTRGPVEEAPSAVMSVVLPTVAEQQVDGVNIQGYTNQQAVEVLRHTGQTVHLKLIRRGFRADEEEPPTLTPIVSILSPSATIPTTATIIKELESEKSTAEQPAQEKLGYHSVNAAESATSNKSNIGDRGMWLRWGSSLRTAAWASVWRPAVVIITSVQSFLRGHIPEIFHLFNSFQKPDPQTELEGRSLWAGRERKDGLMSHCGFGLFLSLQNNIDLSSALVSEVSETNDIEEPQDTVTEEAIGSPLAMWEMEIQNIELEKGEGGLGFSILDYQDPLDPSKTVIVIRSLVPNGVAEMDGRLLPGDRLMYVNDTNLENATLEDAVQALKGAKVGKVQLGVAKPLPESGLFMSHSFGDSPEGSPYRELAFFMQEKGVEVGCVV